MECIKLDRIAKSFLDGKVSHKVILGLDLTVQKGEMISIMGRSGSGKTTLLHIIAGMLMPDSGSYYYDGKLLNTGSQKELSEFRRRNIAYITQTDIMLYDRNVQENILLSTQFIRCNKRQAKQEATELAERLHITDLLYKNPLELSGGERQKVSIARALLGKKGILLADEPTGALDEEAEQEVLNVFTSLNAQGMTVIVVTHDWTVANACNTHYNLSQGELSLITPETHDYQ